MPPQTASPTLDLIRKDALVTFRLALIYCWKHISHKKFLGMVS